MLTYSKTHHLGQRMESVEQKETYPVSFCSAADNVLACKGASEAIREPAPKQADIPEHKIRLLCIIGGFPLMFF